MRPLTAVFGIAAVALSSSIAACGGNSGDGAGPTSPSPSVPTSASITITASGVSPRAVTVAAGSRVTFVNNDSMPHDMQSDPHPEHTDCPEINAVGFLQPGQTRQTSNLNTVRTCGYHDHNQDTNTTLQGTITIQ